MRRRGSAEPGDPGSAAGTYFDETGKPAVRISDIDVRDYGRRLCVIWILSRLAGVPVEVRSFLIKHIHMSRHVEVVYARSFYGRAEIDADKNHA